LIGIFLIATYSDLLLLLLPSSTCPYEPNPN